jgi:hypothetical protein
VDALCASYALTIALAGALVLTLLKPYKMIKLYGAEAPFMLNQLLKVYWLEP